MINEKSERRDFFIILFILVSVKLLIHLATNAFAGYGIFRDEFYYLACSHRLDFGFVDQPPLSIYILTLSRLIFGTSLFALRLLPAAAGALTVFFTGVMVRKLDGGRTALIIACLCVITAPIFLGMNSVYSMNSFDILLWTLAAYIIILIIKEDKPKHWLLLGLIIGLGLLNKISMGFMGVGFFAGLVLSKERRRLTTRWPYMAGLIAAGLFLPYIAWNLGNDMAHLEFIRNATLWKYSGITPLDFILGQFLILNPLTVPVWLAGLYYYFINKEGRSSRLLGIVYVTVFLIFIINGHSKPEYLSPAYPMLFAAGGVQVVKLSQKKLLKWLKYAVPTLIVLGGLLLAPLALPCLPVGTFIDYTRAIGFTPSSNESKELSGLPQFYADMFGWENMAKTAAGVYASLPEEEKGKTVIFAQNYGQAGAIEYFSGKYELPPVISPHNNYWLWGREQVKESYSTIIIIGGKLENHLSSLEEVEEAAVIRCRYCMPYENNQPIFTGRKLKRPLDDIWSSIKNYN